MAGFDPAAIQARWEAEVIRRVTKAAIIWQNEARKVVSVPAPRARSASGKIYAKVPATPGAPPRKLSGRGRASIAYRVNRPQLTASGGTNVFYMERHETHGHEWAGVALANARGAIDAALNGA